MQLSLTSRFVLTLSALAIALIVLPALAIRWSVQQELFDYLQRRESARLQPLKDALQAAWAEHGDWQFLRDKPATFAALVDISGVNERWQPPRPPGGMPPPEPDRIAMQAGRMPPPGEPGFTESGLHDPGSPDPGSLGSDSPASGPPRSGPPAFFREPGPRRDKDPHHDPLSLSQRLQLLDSEQKLVLGSSPASSESSARLTLEHAGAVIGYLQWQAPPMPREGLEQRFLRGQQQTLLLITGAAILLALLVAAWLARGLVRPMLSLAGTVRQLANGDLAARTSVARHDELGQLAHDVDKLATTLTANEQLRRELMADVSHEFRTPLALLQGKIEAMQDGVLPSDAATLASLHNATLRLSRLVDDLHHLALADAGALSLRQEAVDLRALLDTAVQDWAERFAAAELTLTVSGVPSAFALGDGQRLRQIIDNLLHNSLRYTDAGGQVQTQLSATADTVSIRIEDSAPGVSEADLGRLFERFYRVERSRNRAAGGSGLGLGVVKALVQAHGGQVQAAPSPLGGLAITLTFAAAPQRE